MIRGYLFRAKRVDNKEWVYGYYVKAQKLDRSGYEHFIIEEDADGKTYSVIPETVCQCVGLPDKNKKPIFEDDIVKQEYNKTINVMYDPDTLGYLDSESIEGYHIGVVRRLSHHGACIRNPISHNHIEGTERKINRIVGLAGYRCQVIGNIHDNPEFLEVHNG